MTLHVQAAPPSHYRWLTSRLGNLVVTPQFRAIECVDSAGRIVGAVGYDSFTANSCSAHMVAESPVAWRHLVACPHSPAFSYPFEELGLGVLLGVVRSSNKKSMRLTARFGFREAHRIKDGAAVGDDLVLFEMRKEECRWIRHEKRRAA